MVSVVGWVKRFSVALVVICLLFGVGRTEERAWRYPLEFQSQEVQVKLTNWELAKQKQGTWLLLHLRVRSLAREPIYFSWQRLFTLQTADGRRLSPNYDALVDRNGAGLTRTVGDFQLSPKEKADVSIPFVLGEGDLPARLVLEDGRVSELIPGDS